MKKSILLSVMFIAGIVGVIGFTAADFFDSETSTTTIQAGTLDLVTSGTYTCTPASALTNGDDVTCNFTVNNAGNVAGDLYASYEVQSIACTDGANGGRNDGTEFCDAGGNIDAANISLLSATYNAAALPGTPVNVGTLVGLCTPLSPSDNALAAGASKSGTYVFEFTGLNNQDQGDAVKLIFHFYLVEDGGAAPALNAQCP